ncbi:hypothetical protein GLAREA_06253 [Glarea lozoyensis ATCC 20868]|nr:uncharacterized protein GLAREA_06253 [Glarea lozoyensis ATCC 20868]EPE33241.1 hypothetical protein GLAREA_06253 [Glarea lozoyensis ATCC 20868]
MSFLGEIVEVLGEGSAEAGAREGVEVAAKEGAEVGVAEGASSASQVIDEVIIDGAQGAGKEVEGGGAIQQEAQEAMEASQKEMKDVVEKLEKGEPGALEEANAIESSWKTKFKNVWAGAKTFGGFVGVELAKGALFTAGMKALELVFTKLTHPSVANVAGGPGAPATPVDDRRLKIIQVINKSGQILQEALDTWSKWQAAHYDNRDSYGTISAAGFDLSIFQILQNGISSLGDQRDKLVPLVSKAKQDNSLEAVKTLLTADIAYAKAVADLNSHISSNMKTMTDDGLPTRSTEVQAAYSTLVAASA